MAAKKTRKISGLESAFTVAKRMQSSERGL